MYLRTLGWNSFVEEQWNAQPRHNLIPARVVEEQRQAYRVVSEVGELDAEITGHLRHHAPDPSSFPSVGDWVAIRFLEGEQ